MQPMMRPSQSEDDLVALAKLGDKEAFGQLVQRYAHRCLTLAIYLLRNRGDAEDVVQDAFSRAFEHIHQYRGDAGLPNWLLRIVSNQCLMLMRNRRRAPMLFLDETPVRDKSSRIQLAAAGPGPEGELMHKEMIGVLRKELSRVPPLFRDVIILRDIQERSMPDVAGELGITVAAAKSRLLRARGELRLRLKHRFDGTRKVLRAHGKAHA